MNHNKIKKIILLNRIFKIFLTDLEQVLKVLNRPLKYFYVAIVQSLSCVQLFVIPWTTAHPTRLLCPQGFSGKNIGVSCHFLLQGSSQTRDQIHVSYIGKQILYHWATWEVQYFLQHMTKSISAYIYTE